MGNIESKGTDEGLNLDDVEINVDFKPTPLICPSCDIEPAKYKKEEILEDLAQLNDPVRGPYLPYWCPGVVPKGGDYLVTYLSCEKCMQGQDPSFKKEFVYNPDGWMTEEL